MPRRSKPGHSHRLIARPLAASTPIAVAVNDYLEAIETQGYSPYTVTYRSRSLSLFAAWLAERGIEHPGEVTAAVLERYQRSLYYQRKADGSPLSLPTQAGYLTAVKGLFRWLAKTNRVLLNPAAELVPPRVERRLPRAILAHAEVEAVLDLRISVIRLGCAIGRSWRCSTRPGSAAANSAASELGTSIRPAARSTSCRARGGVTG